MSIPRPYSLHRIASACIAAAGKYFHGLSPRTLGLRVREYEWLAGQLALGRTLSGIQAACAVELKTRERKARARSQAALDEFNKQIQAMRTA